ncbi:MAG: HU family DNA-binding protein [Candidatus Doudnabacteria bacterium]|nr:HU family DNA-binding protein [Candidatus Doudnabacteria bacterium]
MNKQDLVDTLANKIGVAKSDAEKMLEGLVEVITQTLKSGQEVSISGFGSFVVKERSARMGVNPQNPEQKIQIAATRVPKFRAGKNLKDAVR